MSYENQVPTAQLLFRFFVKTSLRGSDVNNLQRFVGIWGRRSWKLKGKNNKFGRVN